MRGKSEIRKPKAETKPKGQGGRSKTRWRLAMVLAVVVSAPFAWAETVRVATWSFGPTAAGSPAAEASVKDAASGLKKLNPDVILVQGARDWAMCGALAHALQPAEYTVLVCSAFPKGPAGSASPGQVAILAKRNGYFSWSEAWRGEGTAAPKGGFAFAAVQFGKERVGFFSTRTESRGEALDGSSAAPAAPGRQWLETLATFKSWSINRLNAVVVATGDLDPASKEGGITLQFLGAPLAEVVMVPGPSAEPNAAGRPARVELAGDAANLPGVLLNGRQTACELDLTPPKPKAPSPVKPKVLAEAAPLPEAAHQPGKDAFHRVPTLPEEQGRGGTLPYPVQADMPGKASASAQPATPAAPVASAPTPNPQLATLNQRVLYFRGGAAVALLLLIWLWAWRRRARARAARAFRAPAQLTSGISSYSLVMTPQSLTEYSAAVPAQPALPQLVPQPQVSDNPPRPVETWTAGPVLLEPKPQREALNHPGLRQHLSQWLKQKLVQRLMADRSGLLSTQQAATVKLVSFEERLGRIERQLQEQNRAYEKRISELNDELLAAKEENRELIRARIAQVKAEMASARARLLAQAGAERRGDND